MRTVDKRWEREERKMILAWVERKRAIRARIRLMHRQVKRTPRRALTYLTRWALQLP